LHAELNPRAIGAAEIDSLDGLHEVRGQGFGNIHELLRIAIGKREPAALNLHHDAVALAEGVGDIGQVEGDTVRLAGLEGHGLFEALAELATEGFAADELLVTADR